MESPSSDVTLGAAVQRLDRALSLLESRMTSALQASRPDVGGLFEQDRDQLAAELDAARARERELKEAGAEAARALGRAIDEIRTALGEERAAGVMNEEA
jgi:hypothetical protein